MTLCHCWQFLCTAMAELVLGVMRHPLDNSFSLFRWNYSREGVCRCLLSSCLHFGPFFPWLWLWSGPPAAAVAAGRILRADRLFRQSALNNWNTWRASQLAFHSRVEWPGVCKQAVGGWVGGVEGQHTWAGNPNTFTAWPGCFVGGDTP